MINKNMLFIFDGRLHGLTGPKIGICKDTFPFPCKVKLLFDKNTGSNPYI